MAEPKELVITRVFDAPRANVWRAWAQGEYFKQWWGPKDFTAPTAKMDFSVGGKYLWCMQGPDGNKFWSTGTYQEIVPMERIVYTDSFADEDGNPVPASYYKLPGDNWPEKLTVTVTFEELDGGKTKLTMRQSGVPSGQMEEMTAMGWNQSFDKLAASLA